MDTVTEARMAIAMARQGGVGVLHRNLSVEEQAQQVDMVKRSEAGMITNPVTCGPDATIADVDSLCGRFRISGVPVTDSDKVLVGIVTNRDIRFETDHSRRVAEVMTPMPLVTAPVGVHPDEALKLLRQHKVEKLPLVDEKNRLRGLITVKDFTKSEKFPNATKDPKGRLVVGAAWGSARTPSAAPGAGRGRGGLPGRGHGARARAGGADHDRADQGQLRHRGHRRQRRDEGGSPGPGGRGRGRRQGGRRAGLDLHHPGGGRVGVPQVTAIYEAAKAARTAGVPVIGDGGLQYSGDIAKAIAAGADAVMLGSLLAGCEESPGEMVLHQRQAVQALPGHGLARRHAEPGARPVLLQGPLLPGRRAARDKLVPEGVEGQVPYRGPLSAVAGQLVGGLRAAMGYCGARTIADLQEARFIQITAAGLTESHPARRQMTVEAPNYSGAPARPKPVTDVEIGRGKTGRRRTRSPRSASCPPAAPGTPRRCRSPGRSTPTGSTCR